MQELSIFIKAKWDEIFTDTKEVTVVVIYARTWISQNRDLVIEYISKGGTINIILPNYNNDSVVKACAQNIFMDQAELKKRIKESAEMILDINCNLFLFDGGINSTFYITDKLAIVGTMGNGKKKKWTPALKLSEGDFMEYLQKDIKDMKENSKLVQDIRDL